jgi:hypothetical protein
MTNFESLYLQGLLHYGMASWLKWKLIFVTFNSFFLKFVYETLKITVFLLLATFYVLKRAKIVSLKFVYRFFLFLAQNFANNLTRAPTHVNVMENFSPLYSTMVEL